MQALWSRAGQAHHCGCKACFNAAGGMMRQSATRVTPRKPTFSEIFTACYTGIMATAAVLDAKAKDKRRLELDRQLEEARAELDSLKKKRPRGWEDDPDPGTAGNIENRYKGSLWNHKKQSPEIAQVLDSLQWWQQWAKPLKRRIWVDNWWTDYGFPTVGGTRDILKTDYTTLWDSLVAEEMSERVAAYRIPQTKLQLEMSELSTNRLVGSLVRGAWRFLADPEWQFIRKGVTELREGQMPHYQRDTDPFQVKSCSAQLNRILGSIFANESYNQTQKIGKILHNLLVSPHPPTIFTYNTLIMGFDRLGLHSLADRVIRDLFRTKLEPTQTTWVCILNHHRENGQEQNLYEKIHRMTGSDRRGALIRKKDVEDVLSHDQLLQWAAVKDVAINYRTVHERARFDSDMFTTIIHGMLEFERLRHAAVTFALAVKHGMTLSIQTISRLLEVCIYSLDTYSASQILTALEDTPSTIQAAFTQETDQKYLAVRIQNLLDVCLVDRSVLSVAPWLRIKRSDLPSKRDRQNMRMVSLLHRLEGSQQVIKSASKDVRKLERRIYESSMDCEGDESSMEQDERLDDFSETMLSDRHPEEGTPEQQQEEEEESLEWDAWNRLQAASRRRTSRDRKSVVVETPDWVACDVIPATVVKPELAVASASF
ncbi:hypothetical protein Cob_v003911 [Colletotrichum orbiculare MAFF 240422]|uniref:Uncharacterized protein n=1 Tax=Colletotrichum orbiculare (strain 104-T / ATCC 96160 / CBS 514.97 / LARS 414 / MAFF 240422) TaxID=1213857 RepID=N4VIV0_COLOR|nr:hypothetical protein Cob_v003911 [Colletotrichum orbiculare MAFF 240422]